MRFVLVLMVLVSVDVTAQRKTTFATVTIPQASTALPGALYSGMAACEARLEGGAVRFRMDGVDPTATVGAPLTAGDRLSFENVADAQAVRFFAQTATAGTLSIWCWPRS